MKKINISFIVLLLLASFCGCAKFNAGVGVPIQTPDSPAVKKILYTIKNDAGTIIDVDTQYISYDAQKRLKTRKYVNYGKLLFFEQYTYNADGTINMVNLTNRETPAKTIFQYTYKTNQIDIKRIDTAGNLIDHISFMLDARKLPLTEDTQSGHYVFTHDDKGNVTSRKTFGQNNSFAGTIDTYTYDDRKSIFANMPTNIHLNYISEFGTRVTTVNNLVKWEQNSNPYFDFSYVFNNAGYPISAQAILTNSKPLMTTYLY